MELGERKKRILQAVIQDYIETAEPVGSRTIAKKHIQELSSATIRNEMADLEEMGYLTQPHTSAGRIPSDLGYRVFVDNMISKYKFTLNEISKMQSEITKKIQEANRISAELSELLSSLTKYTALAIEKKQRMTEIKNIQLVWIDSHKIVGIIVTSDGAVKNKTFITDENLDKETVETMSVLLCKRLTDIPAEQALHEIAVIKSEIREVSKFLCGLLEYISGILNNNGIGEISVDGGINLLNFPEYKNVDKAKQVLEFINDKENLTSLAAAHTGSDDIKVIIGHENPFEEFKDCSLILCNYNFGGHSGNIGVVGPTRMDYAKAISVLEYIKEELRNLFD